MNTTKILFALVMIAAIFTACEDNEGTDTAPATDTTAVTTPVIDEEPEFAGDLDTSVPELDLDTTMVVKSEQASSKIKIGYVNSTEILLQMPDIKRADAELQKFAQTLDNQIKKQSQEMQEKYSRYMMDTTATETIMRMRQEELQGMQQRLMELQYKSEQELQQRKEKLYKPIYDKVNRNIKKVAEQYGYTHVLDASAVLYIEDAFDITSLVKRQLGI